MMEPADRDLLAATVQEALATTTDADATLAALGWPDMLAAEPDDAIAVVFEALGRTTTAVTAVDDVVLHTLGEAPDAAVVVVLPVAGPAPDTALTGVVTRRVATATQVVVLDDDGVHRAALADATVAPLRGIDPDACLARLTVDRARLTGAEPDGDAAAATALARRAFAHQMLGATRAMLDLARDHARERVQFGRPVARFQAVRHRLADALVAIEALDATLGAAADTPGVLTAQLAKATAGRTARTVGTHCQQVLAGVGFTTDHPFHAYLKRTMLLDTVFGSADDLVLAIGHDRLAARAVPPLVEL